MINLYFCILMVMLLFFYFYYKRDLLNPIIIYLGTWSLSIGGYILLNNQFGDISNKTVYFLFGGSIFFILGSLIVMNLYSIRQYKRDSTILILNKSRKKYIYMVLTFTILGLILMFIKSIELANMIGFSNYYTSLRIATSQLNDSTGGYGILKYFNILSCSFTNIMLIVYFGGYKEKWFKTCVFLSTFTSISIAILLTGRGYLLTILIIILANLYISISNRKKGNRYIFIFILVFFAVFIIYTLVLRKSEIQSFSINDKIEYIFNELAVYTSGSIPALDKLINTCSIQEYGINIFRTILAILNSVGFNFDVVSLVRESSNTGNLSSNLYTFYDPYIRDFGYISGMLFQFIFGTMHSYFYVKSKKNKNIKFKYFYIITLPALVNQPLIDKYFSVLTTWIYYILILIFYYFLFVRRIKTVERN
ncbi:O-antigen ligase [Clostridium perfringens]|nr:O-antigen ligase [Clostridium perfringens]